MRSPRTARPSRWRCATRAGRGRRGAHPGRRARRRPRGDGARPRVARRRPPLRRRVPRGARPPRRAHQQRGRHGVPAGRRPPTASSSRSARTTSATSCSRSCWTRCSATGSRVVALSSAGHRFSDVDLDDPNFERTPYDPWVAYGRSKTANALFAVELDRRLRDRGAHAYSVHPGGIVTELGRHLTEETLAVLTDVPADETDRVEDRAPGRGHVGLGRDRARARRARRRVPRGLRDRGDEPGSGRHAAGSSRTRSTRRARRRCGTAPRSGSRRRKKA